MWFKTETLFDQRHMFTHATMPADVRASAHCENPNAFFSLSELLGKIAYYCLYFANRKLLWLIYAYAIVFRHFMTEAAGFAASASDSVRRDRTWRMSARISLQ